jgi:hypothetical protein
MSGDSTGRPVRHGQHRDRSGQALVEFALVIPLLLALIIGVVELSRAWNVHQVLTNTAREALRSAVVDNPAYTQDEMHLRINESLRLASLDPAKVEVSIDGWKSGTGNPAKIEIRYPYEFNLLGPLMEWSTGHRAVTLSTAFIMRNE